tara:strand:- start:221 stop:412 length:192 start_codon:yes stop_codon:yes gene_type:complete
MPFGALITVEDWKFDKTPKITASINPERKALQNTAKDFAYFISHAVWPYRKLLFSREFGRDRK